MIILNVKQELLVTKEREKCLFVWRSVTVLFHSRVKDFNILQLLHDVIYASTAY